MYASRTLRLIHHEAFPLRDLLSGNCYAIEETVNPGYRFRIKKTSYLALILTRSGVSDYMVNGVSRRIEPGSLFILPPGISFSEHVPGPEPCHNIYLMLEGALAEELTRKLEPRKAYHYWQKVAPPFEAALTKAVRGIHAQSDQQPFQVAINLLMLAQTLSEMLDQSDEGLMMAGQLERLIEREPAVHWNVAKMARVFSMSESGFAHTFRSATGHPPAAFVRQLRCRMAQSLLEEGKSVAETAEFLGFSNPFHFSRVFKTEIGTAPSKNKARRLPLHRQ